MNGNYLCIGLIPTLLWAQPGELSHQTPAGTIHPMVLVPAGDFWMGLADSTLARLLKKYGVAEHDPCQSFKSHAIADAQPLRQIYLDAYYIDKYEATNAQYAAYLQATGQPAPPNPISEDWTQWQGAIPPVGYENHPVRFVTWDEAQAYCTWAGLRLPTEAEWEKAARGTDQRVFPWGETGWYANFGDRQYAALYGDRQGTYSRFDDGYARTAPVGSYPLGASPYGVFDMTGNIPEWTADVWQFDYYARMPSINPHNSGPGISRSARGGGGYWSSCEVLLSTFMRLGVIPSELTGFRCAGNATSTSVVPQSWGGLKLEK